MIARSRPRRRGGFTLIEAISTIVILSIVGGVASNIVLASADAYFEASTRGQVHTEISVAMDRIVRELRDIDLDPGAGGVAPNIDDVTAASIDWEGDDSLSMNGTDLQLEIDSSRRTLLTDVTAFAVQAYDEDGAALGATLTGVQCDPVRRISLTITVTRSGVAETVRTLVFLRSTMAGGA